MQISQIRQLPDKSPILEPVSGILTEVYPIETHTTNYGNGPVQQTKQNAKLTQGNDSIYVEFSGVPQDMMTARGQHVTMNSSQTQHGWNGVKVNKYFSQKNQEEIIKLRITSSAKITVAQPTYNTNGQQMQTGVVPANSQTRGMAIPTGINKTPTSANTPINGQTVGMAINNACELIHDIEKPGSPEFSMLLHKVASDIIRVSKYLEGGNLADHPRDRKTIQSQDAEIPATYNPNAEQQHQDDQINLAQPDKDCPF